MENSYTFLLSLCVIVLGYLLKRIGILQEEQGRQLSRVVINVTLPALILGTISTIDLDFSLILAPISCFLFSLLASAVSLPVFRNEERSEKGVARMNSLGFNIGLFAYPIIEGLFGSQGLKTIAMFDFGNAFIVFGLAYFLGYSHSARSEGKPLNGGNILGLFLKSIPFMSYIVALTINLSGWTIPPFPSEVLGILGRANMGLVLIVMGLNLSFRFDRKHWSLILKVLGLRYALGLTAGLLLYFLLPFSQMYRTILLFGLMLPVPVSVIPFSVEFDFDTRISGTIANLTILISFAFMWLFMLLLY